MEATAGRLRGDGCDADPIWDREVETENHEQALARASGAWQVQFSHLLDDSPFYSRRFREAGTAREGVGHGRRTADLLRGARLHGRAVGSEHDVWVEHGKERVEITAA